MWIIAEFYQMLFPQLGEVILWFFLFFHSVISITNIGWNNLAFLGYSQPDGGIHYSGLDAVGFGFLGCSSVFSYICVPVWDPPVVSFLVMRCTRVISGFPFFMLSTHICVRLAVLGFADKSFWAWNFCFSFLWHFLLRRI